MNGLRRVLVYAALALVAGVAGETTTFASASTADDATFRDALLARGFVQVGERNGVRVYRHLESPTIQVIAEGTIPAAPDRVLATLLDYEAQQGRIARLSESEVLERGRNSLVVYQRLNLPFIDDRDFTLAVRWGHAGKVAWVKYDVAEDKGPAPKEGVVRLHLHSGKWHVLPGPTSGTTTLRLHVSIDLAGLLPKPLVRAGAGRDLPDVFGAICKLAVEPGSETTSCP